MVRSTSVDARTHNTTRTVEVTDAGKLVYRRNRRREKSVILNEEGSPRIDVRYAPRQNVTFAAGEYQGALIIGGKGEVLEGAEAQSVCWAIAATGTSVTLIVKEAFKESEQ